MQSIRPLDATLTKYLTDCHPNVIFNRHISLLSHFFLCWAWPSSYQKERVAWETEQRRLKVQQGREEFHALLREMAGNAQTTFVQFQGRARNDARFLVGGRWLWIRGEEV